MLFKPKQKPSMLLRAQNALWPRRGVRRAYTYLWHRMTRITATPHVVALGLAAGAFASFTPFIGLHFLVGGLLAFIVGGNLLASAIGTCVGNPLSFPFIWLSTYNLGGYLMGYDRRDELTLTLPDGTFMLLFKSPLMFFEVFWDAIGPVVVPMLLGSVPLGLMTATIVYFASYPVVTGYQCRRKERLLRRKERLSEGKYAGPNAPTSP